VTLVTLGVISASGGMEPRDHAEWDTGLITLIVILGMALVVSLIMVVNSDIEATKIKDVASKITSASREEQVTVLLKANEVVAFKNVLQCFGCTVFAFACLVRLPEGVTSENPDMRYILLHLFLIAPPIVILEDRMSMLIDMAKEHMWGDASQESMWHGMACQHCKPAQWFTPKHELMLIRLVGMVSISVGLVSAVNFVSIEAHPYWYAIIASVGGALFAMSFFMFGGLFAEKAGGMEENRTTRAKVVASGIHIGISLAIVGFILYENPVTSRHEVDGVNIQFIVAHLLLLTGSAPIIASMVTSKSDHKVKVSVRASSQSETRNASAV
jgi:uncharacterized membrane protein